VLQKYNRVAKGITMERILRGIRALRDDPDFTGSLTLQCMFMPMNLKEAEQLAALIRDLKPDEVQLNTPRRPHPKEWYQEARGNHQGDAPVETVTLKTISEDQAAEIEKLLLETTGVPIRSIYRKAPK